MPRRLPSDARDQRANDSVGDSGRLSPTLRTPIDFAPAIEKLRAMMSAPPMMPPPAPPSEPAGLPHLRQLFASVARLLGDYEPAYSVGDPLEVFLAASGATGAGFRLRAISELLNEGVCGLVAAGMARSLLEDAASRAWVAEDRTRDASVVDHLAAEWVRLLSAAKKSNVPARSLDRWLAPAAWAGSLTSSSSKVAYPGDKQVVDRLSEPAASSPDPATPLRLPAIATMAALLKSCGHFNRYAALLCPFNWDSAATSSEEWALGGRLMPEMEAVVIHIASAATFTICVTTAWADRDPKADARTVLEAVGELIDAIDVLAPTIHGLGGLNVSPSTSAQTPAAKAGKKPKLSKSVVEPASRWVAPDGADIERVRAAATSFFEIGTRTGPQLVPMPPVSRIRYVVLPLLASTMWAARTVAHPVNTTTVATHAARQLLEEGVKWRWTSAAATVDDGVARKQALIAELEYWRDFVSSAAAADGVASNFAAFEQPSGFDIADLLLNNDQLLPAPTWGDALAAAAVEENGLGGEWVRLAYSLLSQVTHHTPIGALHAC